jgi:hypothetical protein
MYWYIVVHHGICRARSGEARWRRSEDLLTDVVAQWSRHRAGSRLIASSNPTAARNRRRPCGLAWTPFRTLMVEYINKWDFVFNQSPGCRQGAILAPLAAWQPLPGSRAVSALGHFGTRTRPRGRARRVTSDAADSDAAGIDSGERSDACRAERSQLRSRKRALREQATPVWRARHDPGGRPGDWASDNLPQRSRQARCLSRPAQGHAPRSRRSRRRSRHSRRRLQRPR